MFVVSGSTAVLYLCVFLQTLYGGHTRTVDNHRPGVVKVAVKEGSDVILPCSLSNEKNLASELFDWKKDGQKEVFLFDAGIHYNNGRAGQDEQFKGRVSHFSQELKNGNASIMIRNTKMGDRGNYTCNFPRLQPKEQMFHIELVVGSAPKPLITILDATEDGWLLKCFVKGAFPKPNVKWQDSAGNLLPAQEPQVSNGGDRYNVTLLTTVTKTDHFCCVVKQQEIGHETRAEIYVPFYEKECHDWIGWLGGWALGAVTVVAVQALLIATKYITIRCNKGPRQQGTQEDKDSSGTPLNSHV